MTTSTSFEILPPVRLDPVSLAAAAYLARFKGRTRVHTQSDLRCFLYWCAERGLDPLTTSRPHIELYVRWTQEQRAPAPTSTDTPTASSPRTCPPVRDQPAGFADERAVRAGDGIIPDMRDAPFIRSSDGDRRGITEGRDGTDVVVANKLLAALLGKPLVQFRMGYGVHLEAGNAHEITIETPFEVEERGARWAGEPLTAGAAGALLPLNQRELTSAHVGTDGTLVLGLGSATVTVPPVSMYEAWQVRGPDGLLIVCSPGGDYIAVWEPTSRP